MRIAIIDVESERRIAARDLLPKEQRKGITIAPWKVGSMLSRIVFFGLTTLGVWWFFWLVKLVGLPEGILTGVLGVASAEILARRRHFYRTGIETALYLTALCSFIVSLPGEGKPEAILLFVAATLWVGLRLASALWLAASVALLLGYIAVKSDSMLVTGLFAGALLGVALALDLREWRRPVMQRLIALMLLLLPIATAVFLHGEFLEDGLDRSPLLLTIGIGIGGLLLAAEAIRRGSRPLLFPSLLIVVVTMGELLSRVLRGDVVSMIVGLLLVVSAFTLERRLRGRTRGFTSDRWDELPLERLVESGAVAALGHEHMADRGSSDVAGGPAVETSTTGGSFGGGGATGSY